MYINPYAAPGIIRKQPLSINLIVTVVCSFYSQPESLIHSPSRQREVVELRQRVMYIARHEAEMTYDTIAAWFKMDRATILYNCREAQNKIELEPVFAAEMKQLRETIALALLGL